MKLVNMTWFTRQAFVVTAVKDFDPNANIVYVPTEATENGEIKVGLLPELKLKLFTDLHL